MLNLLLVEDYRRKEEKLPVARACNVVRPGTTTPEPHDRNIMTSTVCSTKRSLQEVRASLPLDLTTASSPRAPLVCLLTTLPLDPWYCAPTHSS